MSRVAFENNIEEIYIKAALLNKALNGIDLFGHVEMPQYFLLVHPVGSIVGRARIGDRVVIYQNVTIGGKHTSDGQVRYPTIGDNVCLYSNTSVLGDTNIPDNCILGAGTSVMDHKFTDSHKIILGSIGKNNVKNISQKQKLFFK